MTNSKRLDLDNPADIAAIVPYLLGFHPHDRLAILALRGARLLFAASAALPYSDDPDTDATSVAARIAAHRPNRVLLIGYGDHEPVATAADHTSDAFTARGVTVVAALRVHNNQLWHLRCADPDCQINGVPFDPSTTAAAAYATYRGLSAAQNIDAIAARLAPITAEEREGMRSALIAAHQYLDGLAADGTDEDVRARFADLVERLIREAHSTYAQQRRLTDSVAALLLALLTAPSLRDQAIKHIDGDDLNIRIWTDLTRRADTSHTAAPATLLAFAALLHGNGLLARLAIERAHEADPDDPLIHIIAQATGHGIHPDIVRRLLHE